MNIREAVEVGVEGTTSTTTRRDSEENAGDEYRLVVLVKIYDVTVAPRFMNIPSFVDIARKSIINEKWREVGYDDWDSKTVMDLKTKIKESLKLLNPVDELEIIVCGGTTHGKSSFINNCVSALNGSYCQVADLGSGREQITKQYREYQSWEMENGSVKILPLVFADTRGFSDSKKLGAPVAAIKACIMGKVVNGETIDPAITDKEWNKRKPNKSKVSHIVFVADANNVPDNIPKDRYMDTIYKNLRQIRTFSRTESIPVAAFLTKCDELEPQVKKDLRILYCSEIVQRKIDVFSKMLDIAANRVFPVVNYTNETNASNEMMVQTLLALKECIKDIMAGFYCRRK